MNSSTSASRWAFSRDLSFQLSQSNLVSLFLKDTLYLTSLREKHSLPLFISSTFFSSSWILVPCKARVCKALKTSPDDRALLSYALDWKVSCLSLWNIFCNPWFLHPSHQSNCTSWLAPSMHNTLHTISVTLASSEMCSKTATTSPSTSTCSCALPKVSLFWYRGRNAVLQRLTARSMISEFKRMVASTKNWTLKYVIFTL